MNTDKQADICQNDARKTAVFVFRTDTNDLRFGAKTAYQTECAVKRVKQAYKDLWNVDAENLNLRKLPCGKWVCDKGYFSVSHSGNYVAVAVGTIPVGIDLQRFSGVKIADVAKKFFTEKEKLALQKAQNPTDAFYVTWCKKEALWKSLENQPATIKPVETTGIPFTVQVLKLEEETYFLAVTGEAIVIVE